MHPTTERLLEAIRQIETVDGPSDLARALNVSPQVINGWKTRGVSKEGIIAADEKFGIRSAYIKKGKQPVFSSPRPQRLHDAAEDDPRPAVAEQDPPLREQISALLLAFKLMTPAQRITLLQEANKVASQNIDVIKSYWAANDRRRSAVSVPPDGKERRRRAMTETDNFAGKPPEA